MSTASGVEKVVCPDRPSGVQPPPPDAASTISVPWGSLVFLRYTVPAPPGGKPPKAPPRAVRPPKQNPPKSPAYTAPPPPPPAPAVFPPPASIRPPPVRFVTAT